MTELTFEQIRRFNRVLSGDEDLIRQSEILLRMASSYGLIDLSPRKIGDLSSGEILLLANEFTRSLIVSRRRLAETLESISWSDR
jgi:hypothetical protein